MTKFLCPGRAGRYLGLTIAIPDPGQILPILQFRDWQRPILGLGIELRAWKIGKMCIKCV